MTLTGRAAGCNAVILATSLQGERPGEAERDGKMRRAMDGVAGVVPAPPTGSSINQIVMLGYMDSILPSNSILS